MRKMGYSFLVIALCLILKTYANGQILSGRYIVSPDSSVVVSGPDKIHFENCDPFFKGASNTYIYKLYNKNGLDFFSISPNGLSKELLFLISPEILILYSEENISPVLIGYSDFRLIERCYFPPATSVYSSSYLR